MAEKTVSNGGRKPNGRFDNGNKYGNGRPAIDKDAVRLFYNVLYKTVKAEDIKEVLEKMLSQAKRGDVAMAKLLLAYYAGEPDQNINNRQSGTVKVVVEHQRTDSNNP